MKLHFLASSEGVRLTKRYHMIGNDLQKDPYPHVGSFNSFEVDADTIEDICAQLVAHAGFGHCLLKGLLDRQLHNESRAGHTNSDEPTSLLVLDNDNLHDLEPQELMALLGLGDVDYVIQYSASAGIEIGKNGYHLFVLLDQPWSPADLKLRLRAWNLDIPQIRKHFRLSRTNNGLRWPLDISVCQNDKLIYIAPPTLGPGVECRLEAERIQLVKGEKRTATLVLPAENEALLRQREITVLNALRVQAGLEPSTDERCLYRGEMIAKNPDQAQVTARKQERGFVYLNLNGGDSWGYYHPIHNADILYNFKNEPNYLTQELLPDYYPEAVAMAEQANLAQETERQHMDMAQQSQRICTAEENGEPFVLAFRDMTTDTYYVGWINPKDRVHRFHEIGSKNKINEFYVQHGYQKVEIVPSVEFRFEPSNDVLYDLSSGFINQYIASSYLKAAQQRDDAELPPNVARVIRHALGDDDEVFEHFLNWLAVLFRYRSRTETAWILQGTTGTGKGILFREIIRPLIGERYCREVNLANLEEQFNGFAENTIVLFIDEVDTDQVKQMSKLIARFKSMITEDKIPLRAMRQDLREVSNHLNLILSSNQPNSMRIEANDRRFNVCPRQENKLLKSDENGEELTTQIRSELQELADYLLSREADRVKARQALNNEPKRLLQIVTQNATEEVALALREGNLSYFIEQRPTSNINSLSRASTFDGQDMYIRFVYREFLAEALDAVENNTKHVVRHEKLFAVFELLVGEMPKSKAKLTKRLGHHHLTIEPHTQGATSIRGLGIQWQVDPEQLAQWRTDLVQDELKISNDANDYTSASRSRETALQGETDGSAQ